MREHVYDRTVILCLKFIIVFNIIIILLLLLLLLLLIYLFNNKMTNNIYHTVKLTTVPEY